jgi:uncharacterized protein (DUF1800 family)
MTYVKQLAILAVSVTLISFGSMAQAATFEVPSKSDLDVVEAKVRAAQFLSRATFGPTKADIDPDIDGSMANRILAVGARNAFEEWIDEQFDETLTPPTYHHPLAKQMILDDGWDFLTPGLIANYYRHYAWWHAAITAPDQLRQRVAWALSQIFVINDANSLFNQFALDDSGEPRYLAVADYYDMLVRNALGDTVSDPLRIRQGNYRETLEDVTRHPVMGIFLSHLGNKKANELAGTYPDENYGREVEQLFSIGLYLIKRNGDYVLDKNKDPIPSYDNDDILTFARVFTGLTYPEVPRPSGSGTYRPINLHVPMEMNPKDHDTGEKVLHNGTVLPELCSETDGPPCPPSVEAANQDIVDALDNLFEHQNTGPFLSRLLIQRLVKSNPTSRYIDAVAAAFNDNGAGVRGDFKAMVKEILLNNEAMESYSYSTKRRPWRLLVEGGGTENSRLQEPVLRYTAYLRAFGMASTHPSGYYSIQDRIASQNSYWLNQEAYRAPHVFNFYLPSHVPGGELQDYRPKGRIPNRTVFAPEFEIMTAVATNRIANHFLNDVRSKYYVPPETTVKENAIRLWVRQYDTSTSTYETVYFYVPFDFSEEIADATNPNLLIENLNILLCHGSLSDTAKASLAGIIEGATTQAQIRAEGAILALLTAPDCAVHE